MSLNSLNTLKKNNKNVKKNSSLIESKGENSMDSIVTHHSVKQETRLISIAKLQMRQNSQLTQVFCVKFRTLVGKKKKVTQALIEDICVDLPGVDISLLLGCFLGPWKSDGTC